MAVPKYDELMKPLLVAVQDGEVYKMKDVTSILAQQLNLSAEELAELLPSGRQTVFKNRVSWAKTYLKKAGLLDSPARATIVITDAGKKVVADNPDKIDSKYLEQFPSFVDFTSAPETQDSGVTPPAVPQLTNLTPDDQLEEAYKQINASLASDLLSEVLKINSYTFEKLVVDLLSKMGYGTVAYGSHATVASGDEGIDGVIMEDKLGFSLIYVQAKEWALDKVVSRPDIQSFVGAIAGKHGDGLFVTTARFSQQARDYAETHHIILIDGERLANLMIEYNFCVSTRKTFEIKAIDTDALAEYQDN
ncbi:winged helix-turn-helix domain-containing protein [Megasphaera elsdenii]|uniref:winged helix-turn-helix domain-containing protein n=1 Tax=Megasphaera elsdenii TaxID=907 RepID=UPI0022E87103|nr:winged helix-turn-helix domain-containing protein [Megasphaera elsdenii]